MEWINVHVSVLDSAEFKSAEPVQQATWLKLLRFCCGQENGGVIEKAAALGDRQWQSLVCATLEEVQQTCGLWSWNEGDLEVNFYSFDHERRTRLQRKAAINTNRKRSGKRHAKREQERGDERDANVTERNVTEQNGTKAGPQEEGEKALPESVSDNVVIQFGQDWPGEMASGTPKMDPAWVMQKLTQLNGRREWPRDWKRWLISVWRVEHRTFSNGESVFGQKKNAAQPLSANVEEIARQKKIAALSDEEDELAYDVNAMRQNNIEVPPEKEARLKAVREEIKKLRTI